MSISGTKVSLRPLEVSDASALHDLRVRERDFLEPWEPTRTPAFWTLEAQRALIEADVRAAADDRAYAFGIFRSEDERLVGRVALSNVVRGSWQNATLGYFVGGAHGRRGYASEAVRLAVRVAFEDVRLHRVQASVMPRNSASRRVLEKAGFLTEGIARHYLEINGVWEDHILYAITIENFRP